MRKSIATFLVIAMLAAASMSAIAFAVDVDDYVDVVATNDCCDNGYENGPVENGPENGYPENGYPENGPENGYPENGYPENGPENGYPENGYPENGPENGYPENGYPENGPENGYGNWCCAFCYGLEPCGTDCDCGYDSADLPATFTIVATSFRGSLEDFRAGNLDAVRTITVEDVPSNWAGVERWTPAEFTVFLDGVVPEFMFEFGEYYFGWIVTSAFNAETGTFYLEVLHAPLVEEEPPNGTPPPVVPGPGPAVPPAGNVDGDDGDDADEDAAPANNRRPATGPATGDANNAFAQIAVLAILVATVASAGLLRTREEV